MGLTGAIEGWGRGRGRNGVRDINQELEQDIHRGLAKILEEKKKKVDYGVSRK